MVVDETQVPRVLLSQGLYIQSPFLLKSSETHMTSHELVSEGLVYGCLSFLFIYLFFTLQYCIGLETVNETFCFFIFIFDFIWFRISQVS